MRLHNLCISPVSAENWLVVPTRLLYRCTVCGTERGVVKQSKKTEGVVHRHRANSGRIL
jgi:ribosomal protein S14